MTGVRRLCGKLAVALTALTAFLLPVKFGGLSGLPEAPGFYPSGAFEWLIVTWPAPLFPLFSGILLLLCVLGVGARRFSPRLRWFAALWAAGPILGVLLSAISLFAAPSGEGRDFFWNHAAHWCGLSAWCLCVTLLLADDPRRRRILIGAMLCGTFFSVLSGWHQYFWGFEETRRFFADAAAHGAVEVGEQLRIKLEDDRVYSTFSSCNNFAGFLLLSGALLVSGAVKFGDRFEPRRLSRRLFGVVAAVLTFGLLPLTRSRGALLCALLAALGAFLASRLPRRAKVAAAVVSALALLGGAWYVKCAGRGFSSGAERLDYHVTIARLVAAHPLSGCGWHGFFREHMRVKRTATDEAAHDPHDFIAAFAAAGGVPAGIIALAAFLFPLCFVFRGYGSAPPWRKAAVWGVAAFSLHMLMEMDHLVPGSVAAFLLILASLLVPDEPAPEAAVRLGRVSLLAGGVLLSALALFVGFRQLEREFFFARFCSIAEPEPGSTWVPPSVGRVEAALGEALRARPGSPFVLDKAADFHAAFGDPRRAEELYRQSLAAGGPRPGPFWRLGNLLERCGRRAEAEACRDEAVRLFPAKYRPLRDRIRHSSEASAK